jgi:hypothetical protein
MHERRKTKSKMKIDRISGPPFAAAGMLDGGPLAALTISFIVRLIPPD